MLEDYISARKEGVKELHALESRGQDPYLPVLAELVPKLNQLTQVPLGLVAIIYESRPNVTSDAAALALASGSACVLRGGKEAFRSNNAIVIALKLGLADAHLPADLVALVQDTSRASATELMRATGLVDLLIPRGGAGLILSLIHI